MRNIFLLPLVFLLSLPLFAQNTPISGIINAYSTVTAVDPCANAVSVALPGLFAAGDEVLLIQMKGALVDTTNTSAFGDILNYNNAGNYEFAEVKNVAGNVVFFLNKLINPYDAPGIVQLIKVPRYTSATVTDTLSCTPWNGLTGGVLVFEVSDSLILNADINVNNKGLRLGAFQNSPACCAQANYYCSLLSGLGGGKGEGIVALPTPKNAGKGKAANGGGGGNMHNAGGAGGGNYGMGGSGGNSTFFNGIDNTVTRGVGGAALDYSLSKLFIGAGGGSGHVNNGSTYGGGRGGGLIIIRANTVVFNHHTIQANGQPGDDDYTPPTDGLPGGGAGGTIVLDASDFPDSLFLSAKGGAGGSHYLNSVFVDGTGGGAGGGALIFTVGSAPLAGDYQVSGGAAGTRDGIDPYGAGPGEDGGIITGWAIKESPDLFVSLSTMTALANSPVCQGDTLFLNATLFPGTTYSWTGPNGFIDSVRTPFIPAADLVNGGNYMVIASSNGCTSPPAAVPVVINLPSLVDISPHICQGETYQLPDGSPADTTGSYPVFFTAANGCDSIVTTHLTVFPTFSISLSPEICEGDLYTLPNGVTVNLPGAYPVTLASVNGCDSLVTTNLVVHPLQTSTTQAEICDGDLYFLPDGSSVGISGTYPVILPDIYGCDSTVVTQLLVHPLPVTNLTPFICQGETYTLPNGNQVSTTGNYPVVLNDQYGCDSTVITQLTVRPIQMTAVPAAICEGASYVLPNGNAVSAAGVYPVTLSDQYGCDSIVTTTLSIIPTITTQVDNLICDGETYILPDGSAVALTGTYPVTLTAASGCDSVVITHLFVAPVPDTTLTATICQGDTYIYDGITYSQEGIYKHTYQTWLGCDSIVRLDLQVIEVSVDLGQDQQILLGDTIKLSADIEPFTLSIDSIQWSPDSLIQCELCPDVYVNPAHNSRYAVRVVTADGCEAMDEILITVLKVRRVFVPNVFSPNDDGLNDRLQIFCGNDVKEVRDFRVFDRWGNLVFQAGPFQPNDASVSWDGSLRGKRLDTGVYVYFAEVLFDDDEVETIKGDVTIMR